MEKIRAALIADAPAVVRRVLLRWDQILEQEPWWSAEHVDEDSLAELIRVTADAALRDARTDGRARAFIDIAMKHGQDRQEGGYRDALVHHEFLLLRRALREDLREQFELTPATHAALTRLDAALSHAEIASLYGYHQHDLPEEAAEKAPSRLAREWERRHEDWSIIDAA